MVMALEVTPRGGSFTYDSWDGYRAERRELLEFIRDRRIADVSFLTGDIHTFFAGNVDADGREAPATPVATEFVGGAITLVGHRRPVRGRGRGAGRRLPGRHRGQGQQPAHQVLEPAVQGLRRARGERDRAARPVQVARTVLQPRATSFTSGRFRVARGTPAVEVLA